MSGQEDELERERQLVARAQSGDRLAIGELLHRHGPALYRSVLLPRLGSEAAAKDALGETYARVVARLDQFTWQNVGFYPWIRMVALRVAIDALRARKKLLLWEADDVAREVDACSTATPLDQRVSERRDREAARRKVEQALSTINPRYAHAIRLRVLEERPRDEVAALMEVSPSTFDVLLHRAIAALKKELSHEADGAEAHAKPPPPRSGAAGVEPRAPARRARADETGNRAEKTVRKREAGDEH